MPRIRSVLQHRANRFRNNHAQKELPQRGKEHLLLTSTGDNATYMTDQLIKPQMEPDGLSSGSVYSLEAKDTHATAVETFSSGEENTTYSDEYRNERNENYSYDDKRQVEDGGEFLDLAYEASRQEKNSIRGHDFIDLLQESERHTLNTYTQPQTIEFVDSEDGKVFNITQGNQKKKDTEYHGGLLQNVRSLDDSNTLDYDECSKTLNTNIETLNSVSSHNDGDGVQINISNRFSKLQIDIGERGDDFEECDLEEEAIAYDNPNFNERAHIPEGESLLYDCDDGEMFVPDGGPEDREGHMHSAQGGHYDEDGNFFEQLRNVQSRHVDDYQHMDPMAPEEEVQTQNWQSVTQQIHYENQQNPYNRRQNERPGSPQLEDPYYSDGNSSWEEGSFATGASRTVSRVDTAGDDDETYDETHDGREYYSDEETYAERESDRPLVRMLKKLRNMNSNEDRESSDEEDYDDYDENKKPKRKLKRRPKKPETFFDSIRQIGTDILDETIDYVENDDQSSRRSGRNGTDTIISTFTELLSCGVSSPY